MSKRLKRWLVVGAYVLIVYSTLYIVRPICEFLKVNTCFDIIVNASFIVLLLFFIFWTFARIRMRKKSTYFFLFLIASFYAIGLFQIKIPEEKIHFLEYGLLAFFIYRAVVCDLKGWHAYLAAFVCTAIIGWGDEVIQYFLPNRYYQVVDVILNAVSGGLGLFWVFIIKNTTAVKNN